jgi:hypothetical protein
MMYDIHKQILSGTPLKNIVDAEDGLVDYMDAESVIDAKATSTEYIKSAVPSRHDKGSKLRDEKINHLSIKKSSSANKVCTTENNSTNTSSTGSVGVDTHDKGERPRSKNSQAAISVSELASVDEKIHNFRVGEVFELSSDMGNK